MFKPPPGVAIPGRPQPPRFPQPRPPAVVFQPKTYRALCKGVNLVADAIRPTLGPLPRLVALERVKRTEAPELLDDGATIARRIIAIRPRSCDVGAMLLRGALWKMHNEVGDGTATAAVLFQAILNAATRAVIQQGYNAMLLRAGLEKGLQAVCAALQEQAAPLAGAGAIETIARGMCQGDAAMAALLGEIFDIVGPDGMIVVEKWNRAGLEREYVEGTYWELSGWASRQFLAAPTDRQVILEDAALLITDLKLKDPHRLIPVLERSVKAGVKRLVIVAAEFSDAVIGLLVNNNRAKTIQSLAVRTPRIAEFDRVAVMEDLAVLSGGRAFYTAAADNALDDFAPADLGRARRAWATESQFGIFGGQGDPRQVRAHLARVQTLLRSTNPKEHFQKSELQKRVGRLLGGTAILRVGGLTDTEVETRKEAANRAVMGLRHALRGGVLPGGGVAFLNAQAALAACAAESEEEAAAYQILAAALEEPLRVIAHNAGFHPDVLLEKVKAAPPGHGLDAISGQIVEMRACGILDAAEVMQTALRVAVSGASMALTTDTIIHHAEPAETVEP